MLHSGQQYAVNKVSGAFSLHLTFKLIYLLSVTYRFMGLVLLVAKSITKELKSAHVYLQKLCLRSSKHYEINIADIYYFLF